MTSNSGVNVVSVSPSEVSLPLEPDIFRYTAFISYRHVEPDRIWAEWLHTALETYRVPANLRPGKFLPTLGKVFRDNEELAAAPDLGAEIEEALRASRTLIVVCSPKTPHSSWVNKEIQFFRKLGRDAHILALLVEGEPADAFPHSLCEAAIGGACAGSESWVEPLAADVRHVATESRRTRRRRALLRIASRLLGCSFDDLLQRDAERRRRHFYQVGLVMTLVGFTVLASTAFGLYQQGQAAIMRRLRDSEAEATRQRDEAREKLAELERSSRRERAGAATDRVIAQLPDLRRRALWKQALNLLGEAKNLVGPDSDPEVTDKLGLAESEIRLLEKLDDIRMRKAALAAETPENVWNAGHIRNAYHDTFHQAGYDFYGSDQERCINSASDKLLGSPIKDELIAALDDWTWGIKEDSADVIWEITARATGREWRRELRITSLSAPVAVWLSREVPIEQFSPAIVTGLGFTMRFIQSSEKRLAVRWLEAGAKCHPSDFWVNFYLGLEYLRLNDPESAAGAFRASAAIRPEAILPRKCLDECLEENEKRRRIVGKVEK